MSSETPVLSGFKIPSWFHPFKRMRVNRIIRDLKIASMAMSANHDKLAPLFLQDSDNGIVVMTYCTNDTGDMAQHRNSYVFNGDNRLDKQFNFDCFVDKVINHSSL